MHGETELIIDSTGKYTFRGTVTATGIPSFSYKVMATLRTPGGALLALEAGGEVFGDDTPKHSTSHWDEGGVECRDRPVLDRSTSRQHGLRHRYPKGVDRDDRNGDRHRRDGRRGLRRRAVPGPDRSRHRPGGPPRRRERNLLHQSESPGRHHRRRRRARVVRPQRNRAGARGGYGDGTAGRHQPSPDDRARDGARPSGVRRHRAPVALRPHRAHRSVQPEHEPERNSDRSRIHVSRDRWRDLGQYGQELRRSARGGRERAGVIPGARPGAHPRTGACLADCARQSGHARLRCAGRQELHLRRRTGCCGSAVP